MGADRFVQLTTSPAFAWWIRHVASRLDPLLFKATNGRRTSMGPPPLPMVTITTIGRRSGRLHAVHLACVEHDGGWLVVASAMGQARHPSDPHGDDMTETELEERASRDHARARTRASQVGE